MERGDSMNTQLRNLADKLLFKSYDELTDSEQRIIMRIAERTHISRNTNREFYEQQTFGQRIADRVASFGGSWPLIIIFITTLIIWVVANLLLLSRSGTTFDPYPFILLNLFLSMLAALQAPVILMSQNRQAAKDRLDAKHDYEVNLKAELEIMELHNKLDTLREKQWTELLALQQEQITLLTTLLGEQGKNGILSSS